MAIETDFSFVHLPGSGRAAAANRELLVKIEPAPDLLGLLRGMVGTDPAKNSERVWVGQGFNMIWRPNFGKVSGPTDFFLELNLTDEKLSFTDITGTTGIANRGFLQDDVFMGGMAYLQTINDSFDGTGQHFETGVWTNVPLTTDPAEPPTVVRMGSIPHGTTINMQGKAFTAPKPLFNASSITPFTIGSPDDGKTGLVHFPEEDLTKPSPSRTDLARVKRLTQAHLSNPNLFLSDAIAGQTITSTVVIEIASDTSPKGSVPDAGGGTANIAFLTGVPPTKPNAVTPSVTATFWIEQVEDAKGHQFLQLQYTQRVLLNFNGLSWPHVTVATLRST